MQIIKRQPPFILLAATGSSPCKRIRVFPVSFNRRRTSLLSFFQFPKLVVREPLERHAFGDPFGRGIRNGLIKIGKRLSKRILGDRFFYFREAQIYRQQR